MSLVVSLHDPDKADAFSFTSGGRDMASLVFSGGNQAVTLYTGNRALARDLAQVFEMHAKDSGLLGLLDLMLTAADDPNRDTLADLALAVQIVAEDCCPVCGQYRPDEDEWHEIDKRLMCASCCDEEADRHGADMAAARLDAADHKYDRRAEVA